MNRFVLVLSAILISGYASLAGRLTSSASARAALAVPFLPVWIVPVIYWIGGRESTKRTDELVHALRYLSMGWLLRLVRVAQPSVLRRGAILPSGESSATGVLGYRKTSATTAPQTGLVPPHNER